MDETSPALIFLSFQHKTNQLSDLIADKKLVNFDRTHFKETASDKSFNLSKYAGSICHAISQGNPIMLSDAHEMISKKGQLSLTYDINTRIGKIPYKIIFVEDEESENEQEKALRKWANSNTEVISVKQFADYVLPTAEQRHVVPDVKVTCGFCTRHMQNDVEVIGHVTRKFGILAQDAEVEHENNAMYFNRAFKGEIIELTVDGKSGGTIIMIPELGAISHITNNTSIKSALSGPVLEKYNDGIIEFTLKDIDENAKQNPNLKVAKIGETDVQVTGWYTYCVQK